MALAGYFETNRMAQMLGMLFQKMTMFGLARSNSDASHDMFASVVRGDVPKPNTELPDIIGSMTRMTVLAGSMGYGYAVCCDFDAGRLKVCDPGERFGTLYECTGKTPSPDEVAEVCTKTKLGSGA